MLVTHTGAQPDAFVTASLCLPDTAGSSATVLSAFRVPIGSNGAWQADLLGQQQLPGAYQLTAAQAATAFWQLIEPQPAGADPVTWSVYVIPGTTPANPTIGQLAPVAAPPLVFGSSPSGAVSMSVTNGVPTLITNP